MTRRLAAIAALAALLATCAGKDVSHELPTWPATPERHFTLAR